MQWVVEPGALEWARERLAPFAAAQVTSLVPGGFDAYLRVLHPTVVVDTSPSGQRVDDGSPTSGSAGGETGGPERGCRWSEVAAWSASELSASSSFSDIATRSGPDGAIERFPGGPRRADVGPELAAVLVELLDPVTATGERCWFAVWEGYGWLHRGPALLSTAPGPDDSYRAPAELPVPIAVRDAPRAWVPQRSYVLYTGPLEDALALGDIEYQWRHGLDLPGVSDEVPDLWWPQSRTWFVGADTDLYSTYIGATRETIDRLHADPRLETLPVTPTDRLA